MFEIILIAAAAVLAAAGLAYYLRQSGKTFLRFRGESVVTCPETQAPVGVAVDALRAAATAPFGGPELRLKACSRWPEREPCGQECLVQIEASPEDCSVRHMLARFYAGTSCAICGGPIGEIQVGGHKPAFRRADGKVRAWSEVAPEDLKGVLETHGRICWNCWVVESFRAEHPDLVVEDPRPARPGAPLG
jgi:hypothetical protein